MRGLMQVPDDRMDAGEAHCDGEICGHTGGLFLYLDLFVCGGRGVASRSPDANI